MKGGQRLCWVCEKGVRRDEPDQRLHQECCRCPRCGGLSIVYDLKGDPLWFRCIGCLHGWLREPAMFVSVPVRPKKEIENFTMYVTLETKNED